MPYVLKVIIVLSVLGGIGWFSNYAYHEVEKSRQVQAVKDNAQLLGKVAYLEKKLTLDSDQHNADMNKKKESLLVMFPNDSEKINELFAPTKPAEKAAAEAEKAPEPVAEPAPSSN